MARTRTFIISDTHFGHLALLDHDLTRKKRFSTIQAIDQYMIDNWVSLVTDDDFIVHLGDVVFRSKDECTQLIRSLPGKKILVRGNHDRGSSSMIDIGFMMVCEQITLKIAGKKILCQHRPHYDKLPADIYGVFHGHIHTGEVENQRKPQLAAVKWLELKLLVHRGYMRNLQETMLGQWI